ncbi:tetratricopeptide repeat protein [Schlesneria sp.]|uniref:tetratricopeptide repeat protein n=1 Tax=Schlesneria sp. TaxID=2762018 RepID=UPI002EFA4C57
MSRSRRYSLVMAMILILSRVLDFQLPISFAEELVGAKRVLEAVQELSEVSDDSDEIAIVAKKIQELPARLDLLTPPDAAAAWIEVYDLWKATSNLSSSVHEDIEVGKLIDALPPPAAWPDLVQMIDTRPIQGSEREQINAIALRMLGHRLLGRMDLFKEDLERGLRIVDPAKGGNGRGGLFTAITNMFQSKDADDYFRDFAFVRLRELQGELEQKSALAVFRSKLEIASSGEFDELVIPDLVRLVGHEEATILLTRAFQRKGGLLNFGVLRRSEKQDNETLVLARELAIEHLNELSQPYWDLCHSIDAVDLFQRFSTIPQPQREWFHREDHHLPVAYYLIGLIVRDRQQDVVKFLKEPPLEMRGGVQISINEIRSILPELERLGHAEKFYTFLNDALKANPELPLWEFYIELSAQNGRSQDALPVVDEAIANDELSLMARRQLEIIRVDALLSADRIDEAVAFAFQILPDGQAGNDDNRGASDIELALKVAEIGRLLDRDEWITRGTDIAEKLLNEEPSSYYLAQFVELLIEVKQLARAERLCIKELVARLRQKDGFAFQYDADERSPLHQLARVYHAGERVEDVLTLLEEAPWWKDPDIGTMLENSQAPESGHGQRSRAPLPLIAAKSLAAMGRHEEALAIAKVITEKWPGYDPGWQLALELAGDEFVPFAEGVFAQDAFEERPLIWLARYYLDRGDLVKAEQFARQAIAIDPSDGEQGGGDRMRVYAVLAEILKQGNSETAKVYQGAVKAIRMAELADQHYVQGMLSRGIRMYRASLLLFADAYCIQSRLAVQLADSGDMEGAARHYQRAFELMPDSFGRVESHCFGCEGVFKGPLAVKIANDVFSRLVAEKPEHPRLHYLLGYLRESEKKYEEALRSFEEAVRLDPDYLNAWAKICRTPHRTGTIHTDRDQATFAILRLDPTGKHSVLDISEVTDLARLWTVLRENVRDVPDVKPDPLFQLTASKLAQAVREGQGDWKTRERNRSRGPRFSSHHHLSSISKLIGSNSGPAF